MNQADTTQQKEKPRLNHKLSNISPMATKHKFESFDTFTQGREGKKVNKIVIHHMALTNFDSVPDIWGSDKRQASAHYGIGKKGEIRAYVGEDNTAWHAGNWEANLHSIGIEHCNSSGEPQWEINQATIDASIKLCADVAKRHGLGKLVPNQNLFPHSHFSTTACPGILKDKLQEIADQANKLYQAVSIDTVKKMNYSRSSCNDPER